MSARRIALLAALVAGALATACQGAASVPEPEAPRATPLPTAYIGALAATPAASETLAAVDAAYEMTRTASMDIAEWPRTSTAPVAAVPRVPRVASASARMVDRGPATERRVALTFDAGADRGYAEQILDTLRDNDVRASFGMTGQWAEANPDLLRRMVAEGHHLINHTQTHDSFTGFSTGRAAKSSEARARELATTEQAVQRIAGATTKPYFRPPYGDIDTSVIEDVYAQGYDIVAMWTVDSQGWNGLSRSAIEARCLRMAVPGAVYVFHVGAVAQDGPALPGIIEGLRKQGYQMGTLDWLLHP
ncbi:MAG: polysaccharide deacetylase family protein [Dehalococcoidia bacterium]|nr:MAG: polysaccharide deacetylase family protein [Dehalococcoidia bacterium]